MNTTKVIFRKFKREGDIIALFPELPGDRNPETCNSYMHIGQHGSASVALVADTRLAKPDEYADLLAELQRIGYADLRIVKRFTNADYLKRKGV